MKNCKQCYHIHNKALGASEGLSISVRIYVPQNKIELNRILQAIAASSIFCHTLSICSQYIPPPEPTNKNKLEELSKQQHKSFLL